MSRLPHLLCLWLACLSVGCNTRTTNAPTATQTQTQAAALPKLETKPATAPVVEPIPVRSTETNDFREVQQAAIGLGKKYHPENVLLVFDIDNTLLAMSQDLGSVQWFRWQEELLQREPNSPSLVARDFNGLLRVQGMIFATGTMRPTQPELSSSMAELQQTGFSTLLLSSRGFEFRDSTRQALQDNQFNLATSALSPKEGFPGPYLPYHLDELSAAGISAAEGRAWEIKKPRYVSYAEGVYLTAGQHKGIMLRVLLHRADAQPQAIVFVDDQPKHLVEMTQAFEKQPVELVLFRLTREDAWANSFDHDLQRQQDTTLRWQRLQAALPDHQPEEVLNLPE